MFANSLIFSQYKKYKNNKITFIQVQQAIGDSVVGDVISTTVKVEGEDVSVIEYTTQSDKKYYPDGNDNQVTTDVT